MMMATAQSRRLGPLLKQHRLAMGLTQAKLAALTDLSPRTISDLERGKHPTPYQDTLDRLIQALQLSPAEAAQL
jgi:transcriptional regulator with XRE-family HTH domain